MNDHLFLNSYIGKFTEGELTSEEENWLLSQASSNPMLRNEMRLDKEISDFFSDPGKLVVSEHVRKAIKEGHARVQIRFYLRIAASVAIFLGLSGAVLLATCFRNILYQQAESSLAPAFHSKAYGLLGFFHPGKVVSVPQTPVKRRIHATQLARADNFAPRPEYEFLVGSVTRDLSVYLIQPPPRVKCNSGSILDFMWRWTDSQVFVDIEITDNKGRVVFRKLNINESSYTLDLNNWNKGLYYYKIETGENLVTIGSITIN